jgi:hypothetical protein
VIQRSVEYSPSRCLSSATHPYSGACQAELSGQAGVSTAGITVTNADDATAPIPGLTNNSLLLAMPGLSAGLGVEQVSKLSSSAQTSAATTTDASGTPTTSGGVTGTAVADTDPSSTAPGAQTATANQSGASPLTATGAAGTFQITPSSGDTGNASAETAVSSAACVDATGAALPATGQPCSAGNVTPTGSAAMSFQLPTADGPVGSNPFTIASVGAAPAAWRATTSRLTTGATNGCPTATGVGCVTAQASRALGTVTLGGLPTPAAGDTLPTNWAGSLIQLTGVRESMVAESGVGARTTPQYTRSGGSLAYYDPATATTKTINLTTLTSNQTVTLPTVTGIYQSGGAETDVSVDATFTAGAPVLSAPTTSATDPTCKTAACSTNASTASVLRATLTYTVTVGGVQQTRFAVVADLGSLLARTSYTAAFDA